MADYSKLVEDLRATAETDAHLGVLADTVDSLPKRAADAIESLSNLLQIANSNRIRIEHKFNCARDALRDISVGRADSAVAAAVLKELL